MAETSDYALDFVVNFISFRFPAFFQGLFSSEHLEGDKCHEVKAPVGKIDKSKFRSLNAVSVYTCKTYNTRIV